MHNVLINSVSSPLFSIVWTIKQQHQYGNYESSVYVLTDFTTIMQQCHSKQNMKEQYEQKWKTDEHNTSNISSFHHYLLLSRWVLYEKPNFKGEKVALDEGDIELTCPFHPPEEQQQQKVEQNGQTGDEQAKPPRKFIIGSLRRAVRVREEHFVLWGWASEYVACPYIPSVNKWHK